MHTKDGVAFLQIENQTAVLGDGGRSASVSKTQLRLLPRFGLKTLLASCLLVAVAIVAWKRARTDTIYHTPRDGFVVFPDGSTYPTNCWVYTGGGTRGCAITDGGYNDGHLVIATDTRKCARILMDGSAYEAVQTNYRVEGPVYIGEYWMRPGRLINSADGTKAEPG